MNTTGRMNTAVVIGFVCIRMKSALRFIPENCPRSKGLTRGSVRCTFRKDRTIANIVFRIHPAGRRVWHLRLLAVCGVCVVIMGIFKGPGFGVVTTSDAIVRIRTCT